MRCRTARKGILSFQLMLLLLLLAASSGCTAIRETGGADRGKPLEMRPFILSGLRPEELPVGWLVFRNQGEWSGFWTQHSMKPAPDVDFQRFTLVIMFLGQKPNPGYSVKITDVREYREKIVVHAVETKPSPEALYAQVIVYPYDAVLIPHSEKQIEFNLAKENDSL